MAVDRAQRLSRVAQHKCVQVIDEEPDMDPPIGRMQHAIEKQLFGVIFDEGETLDVERALRGTDEFGSQEQAVETAREKAEARQPWMRRR